MIMKNENHKELISMLNECSVECKSCAESCKDMPNMKECIRLCNECAQKCEQISAQSNGSSDAYQQCEDICNACADECAHHDNSLCKKCVEICRKCAEACHQAA